MNVHEIKKQKKREEEKQRYKKVEEYKSEVKPEEGKSSSSCPLLAEEWNYPPLRAHTSFLLQTTTFPLLTWHLQFIHISLFSMGGTRAPS